eukprot:TRINITY_DN9475_c0_g1_i1.p1 TRINITY_DN9475_c0_g1~~TRINITY_DN9475_c0_g1_i1.p1  ORF type:complete len:203 (+),score=15.09 TRINITY_DN9475_c0_g1_i1:28-636(+)
MAKRVREGECDRAALHLERRATFTPPHSLPLPSAALSTPSTATSPLLTGTPSPLCLGAPAPLCPPTQGLSGANSISSFSLATHLGSAVVLVFLPGDFKPASLPQLTACLAHPVRTNAASTLQVLVSHDSVYAHTAWLQANGLALPARTIFLQDLTRTLALAFGYSAAAAEANGVQVVVLDAEHRVVYAQLATDYATARPPIT